MTNHRAQVDYLLRWMLSHNLNLVVQFHNDFHGLLKEKYQASEDRVLRADIELYDTMNSANCFLMAFSYLEEMLRMPGEGDAHLHQAVRDRRSGLQGRNAGGE